VRIQERMGHGAPGFARRSPATTARSAGARRAAGLVVAILAAVLAGCSSMPDAPIRTESAVDLQRFMGRWYVIANIPTFVEKGAHNAIESYALDDEGRVRTTFSFNADACDGPLKRYNPTGFVVDEKSRAVWGMQFIWPFRADYRIVYVSPDYTSTIIGREVRDYVWIMARTPVIPAAEYERLAAIVAGQGYDRAALRIVPQPGNGCPAGDLR
jgi:apolipoprotein D and lipocalin family protein